MISFAAFLSSIPNSFSKGVMGISSMPSPVSITSSLVDFSMLYFRARSTGIVTILFDVTVTTRFTIAFFTMKNVFYLEFKIFHGNVQHFHVCEFGKLTLFYFCDVMLLL